MYFLVKNKPSITPWQEQNIDPLRPSVPLLIFNTFKASQPVRPEREVGQIILQQPVYQQIIGPFNPRKKGLSALLKLFTPQKIILLCGANL